MKFNFKRIFYTIVILSIFMLPSCKEALSLQLYDIWGVAIKVKGEERSNFSAYVNIFNDTPQLEGIIKDWSFKIFSGTDLLIEISNNNYKDLGFIASVTIPAPNYYNSGNITIYFGIPTYKPGTVFVDTDIYKGKRPDKFDFRCTIQDVRGDITELTAPDTPIEYLEYDAE